MKKGTVPFFTRLVWIRTSEHLVPRLNSVAAASKLEHIATLLFLGDSPTRQTMRNIP